MSVFDVFYNATLGAERAKKTQSEFDQRYQMAQKGRMEVQAREERDYQRDRYEEAQKQRQREQESGRRQQLTMELVKQRGEAEEYKREQPWKEEVSRRKQALEIGKEREDIRQFEAREKRMREQNRLSNTLSLLGEERQADKFRYDQHRDQIEDERAAEKRNKEAEEDQEKIRQFNRDYLIKKYEYGRKVQEGRATAADKRADNLRQAQAQAFNQQQTLKAEARGELPPGISAKAVADMAWKLMQADPGDEKQGARLYQNFGLSSENALDFSTAQMAAAEFLAGAQAQASGAATAAAGERKVKKEDSYNPAEEYGSNPLIKPESTGMPSEVGSTPPFPQGPQAGRPSTGLQNEEAELAALLGGQDPYGEQQAPEPEPEPYTPQTPDELLQEHAYAKDYLTRARLSGDEEAIGEAETRLTRLEETLRQPFMPEETKKKFKEYGEGPKKYQGLEEYRGKLGALTEQGEDLSDLVTKEKDGRKSQRMLQLLRPDDTEPGEDIRFIPDLDRKSIIGTPVWKDRWKTGDEALFDIDASKASDADVANYQIDIDPETNEWTIRSQEDHGWTILDPRYDYDVIADKWAPILYRQQQIGKLERHVVRKEKESAERGRVKMETRGIVGNVGRTLGAAAAQFVGGALSGVYSTLHPIDTISDFFDEDSPSEALYDRLRDVKADDSPDWLTQVRQVVESQNQKDFRASFRKLTEEWEYSKPVANSIQRVTGTQRGAGESVWDIFAVSPYEFAFDVALDLSKDRVPENLRLPLLIIGDLLVHKGVSKFISHPKRVNRLRRAAKAALGSDWARIQPKMRSAFEAQLKSLRGAELKDLLKNPDKLVEFSEEVIQWAGEVGRSGHFSQADTISDLISRTTKGHPDWGIFRGPKSWQTNPAVRRSLQNRFNSLGLVKRQPGLASRGWERYKSLFDIESDFQKGVAAFGTAGAAAKAARRSEIQQLTQESMKSLVVEASAQAGKVATYEDVLGAIAKNAGKLRKEKLQDVLFSQAGRVSPGRLPESISALRREKKGLLATETRDIHQASVLKGKAKTAATDRLVETRKKLQEIDESIHQEFKALPGNEQARILGVAPPSQGVDFVSRRRVSPQRGRAGEMAEGTLDALERARRETPPGGVPGEGTRVSRIKAALVALPDADLSSEIQRIEVSVSRALRGDKAAGDIRFLREDLRLAKEEALESYRNMPEPPKPGAAPTPTPKPVGTAPVRTPKPRPKPQPVGTAPVRTPKSSGKEQVRKAVEKSDRKEALKKGRVSQAFKESGWREAAAKEAGKIPVVDEFKEFATVSSKIPRHLKNAEIDSLIQKHTAELSSGKSINPTGVKHDLEVLRREQARRAPGKKVALPVKGKPTRPKVPTEAPAPAAKPTKAKRTEEVRAEIRKTPLKDKPSGDAAIDTAVEKKRITAAEKEDLKSILNREKTKGFSADDAYEAVDIAHRTGDDAVLSSTIERLHDAGADTSRLFLDGSVSQRVDNIIASLEAPTTSSQAFTRVESLTTAARNLREKQAVDFIYKDLLGTSKRGKIKLSSFRKKVPPPGGGKTWDAGQAEEIVNKINEAWNSPASIKSKRKIKGILRGISSDITPKYINQGIAKASPQGQGAFLHAAFRDINSVIKIAVDRKILAEKFATYIPEGFHNIIGAAKQKPGIKGLEAIEEILNRPEVRNAYEQALCMVGRDA